MTQSKNIEMDVEITPKSKRLISIDALRGFVMIIMIIDHVRETFFLHMQVGDPVDVLTTSPELFFTRWVSSICAPVFIFLTGLSAWLYSQKHSKNDTAIFLLKRGMFLVLLEVTIISFLWSGKYPPDIFFLQVIWCIGLCMIALAGLIYLPRYLQIVIGAIIIAGHNLLDQIILTSDAPLFIPWAILYQRAMIDFGGGIIARTSYPLLPWMGVILIGYTAGSWFSKDMSKETRAKQLMISGMALILAFIVIRALNFYGDSPWFITESTLTTFMSFISLTKYPPSLLFSLSINRPYTFELYKSLISSSLNPKYRIPYYVNHVKYVI